MIIGIIYGRVTENSSYLSGLSGFKIMGYIVVVMILFVVNLTIIVML